MKNTNFKGEYLGSLRFIKLSGWLIFIISLLGFFWGIYGVIKDVGSHWVNLIMFGFLVFVSAKMITSSTYKEFIYNRKEAIKNK